jgi:PleD family two-component response regulator
LPLRGGSAKEIREKNRSLTADGISIDRKEARKTKRILIIDDDPSIRLLNREELLEEGYDLYKKEV